ncbi:MAG TPA: methyltransferase [Candidatus Binatia bacterium]|nr:methyltransferase [Candidatus Binatia bacterium]
MEFSQLMGLASGHVEARIVQTAVELKVFEAVEARPLSSIAAAAQLQLNERALELFLNALTALGLLEKQGEKFALAKISRLYLLRNSPHYVGGMIGFDAMLWQTWERLPEAIRTGLPARSPDMYQADPGETAIFINAMDSLVKARGDTDVLAGAIDWSKIGTLLDVGSGPATYPIALCRIFPQLRAAIVDLPGTLKITARYVAGANLAPRIQLIPADYRSDPIPGSYDAILLSNIIHGENEDRNAALMRKLAANLNPRGQLIVKDHILDDSRAAPAVGATFSLLMLLTTDGGRCYSFAEITGWMKRAGLNRVERIDLPAPLTSSLVIACQ